MVGRHVGNLGQWMDCKYGYVTSLLHQPHRVACDSVSVAQGSGVWGRHTCVHGPALAASSAGAVHQHEGCPSNSPDGHTASLPHNM